MNKEIYLTFDLDWAIDEVLEELCEIMSTHDLCGTLNVTHNTEKLIEIRNENRLELGIHPNFNWLLSNNGHGDYSDVVTEIKKIVPEAITVRSHALTASSIIEREFYKNGIRYDLNMMIPAYEGLKIAAYPAPAEGGVQVLPFIFEDDIWLNFKEKRPANFYLSDKFDAPRIFNFHPIHLFLNTDCVQTYENARPFFKMYSELKKYINTEKFGIKDYFFDLINVAKERGWTFKKISEGEWR